MISFRNSMPQIDLHGEDKVSATLRTKEFINDSVFLNRTKIIIIHGRGTGVVKDAVFKELKSNKNVENFHLNMNLGSTTVILKKKE